jgi:hypothetical protein
MEAANTHHISDLRREKNTPPPCFTIRRESYFTDQALSQATERLVGTVGICRWAHILAGMVEFRGGRPRSYRLDDISDNDLAFLLGVHLIERCEGGFRLRVSIDPQQRNGRRVNWR